MSAQVSHRSIFDFCPNDEALLELREVKSFLKQTENVQPAAPAPLIELNDKLPEKEREREGSLTKEVSDKMVCTACKCSFTVREEQMEHYKLDWHRFNLRQKLAGLLPVTVEEFERKTGAGDMSSISGSESDSEDENSNSDSADTGSNIPGSNTDSSAENSSLPCRLSSKTVFQNSAGQYLSVHRCILQGKSEDEQDAGSSLLSISKKTVWVILMTGGGHFAGAVFRGKEVIQHKTFHRYTVRAKRGTAQGLRDSQNRSHMPKSAGAALRRYNEAALVKDIQDLLTSWAEHLEEASAIFVRAPSYNKTILFGGRGAAVDKKDPRIRTLPFATRRATFRELQRVHEVLSTVHVYGRDTEMSAVLSPSKKLWKKTVKPAAARTSGQESASAEERHDSSGEEDGDIQLQMETLTLCTLDLRESEIYPAKHKRRRRRRKEGGKMQTEELPNEEAGEQGGDIPAAEDTSSETQLKNKKKRKPKKKTKMEESVDESWDYALRDALFTACKTGDVDMLSGLLDLHGDTTENPGRSENGATDAVRFVTLLNKAIDSSGFTLLHVASAAAQMAAVRLLLDAGADPACKDNKGQTPYIVSPDKDTRNVFRKYMGEHPDRYDYSKAQVPGPLTTEIELKKMEKKRAQKALKKQREKEQKEEKRKEEQEAEEKKRFASLSDREKRILVSKRSMEQVSASGGSLSNVQRCWSCGESLLGKVPFHYSEFSFCTPRCVQAHRKLHPSSRSKRKLAPRRSPDLDE
uniref:Ankyrin repeat and zinc finger peptidyl tRNA hydrolase 1 n=1 Tax=Cynoglossus semilaevis TaxID=244447 RepID=A0A3P8VUP3_CYNSE